MPANPIIESNKDTTTYDVQQRTFIKKPEPKVCPSCGQLLPSEVKPMSTAMNNYISAVEGSQHMTISSDENVIEIKGVKLYKVTGRGLQNKMISSHMPLPKPEPVKPTTSTQPKVA